MRDRYLFSADRKTSEYTHVLEITRGRARLLTPSGASWGWRWAGSLAVLFGYSALLWPVGWGLFALATFPTSWIAWIVLFVVFAVWLIGLFFVIHFWDQKSLLFLADDPAEAMDLVLLGARSFGTFQDVRARDPEGREFHLVVDTHAPRFWNAVRLLQGGSGAFR